MKKNRIIYGEYRSGVQKKAVSMLSEILLDVTHAYPVCIPHTEAQSDCNVRDLYIGTRENNPYILTSSPTPLSDAEAYRITVKDDTVYIEGADDAGVLYGCVDFYDKYLSIIAYTDNSQKYYVNPLEQPLPNVTLNSHPATKNRGIWTWGHVIYDYKGFFDNMTRLKMNSVIIWNDHAPINAREVVDYAHNCGIKVIWGYSWLWGTNCAAVDILHATDAIDTIVDTYEREYRDTGADGIYFQSFTELNDERINGVLIAEAVTDFVNRAAARLFEKYPTLELQFGLHADSVKKQLPYIKNVDPRVRIVWENCGSFPFSYIPNDVSNFESTVDFVKEIATLRGETERFGAVTKGITKLDWSCFEHLEGAVSIGIASKRMKENRVARKNPIWRYIQAGWIAYADYAEQIIRTMYECCRSDLYITALVEDGMFEGNIMYPVALCAEMLWGYDGDPRELLRTVALRNYVDFA